ncbi:FecR family protein [Sphingobacterium spiritivorum]|uniref:Sigma factor regulatory protein, FecR/PupR family n=1 Tax=Sphingobacterium spiritivorum ATCC 33861 TaxID=525373 RepID=D7VL26_SPHSI|nr:FecR domain-containing protein [Sphingobacterium spiritivorum]EFK58299.1 sigma factor regulatory protein, FecR/PupR family [Sphingobacterium spiritivorum ATCC 33861]QQT37053.1 FecR family protein [Sphingobacterium spiritivorum]WQD33824.1 FecR family protein [Sphingobacterium spiritivorum]SUJ27396.1 fec operon regulator FecR [Sphingobacterium spiritivorum]
MLTKEEYIRLYEKYQQGLCTEEEYIMLESYEDSFELEETNWNEMRMGKKEDVKRRIHGKIKDHIKISHFRKYKILYRGIQTAAAVLILCFGAYWLWNLKDDSGNNLRAKVVNKKILPGGNKATLTLDNGTEVDLNALKTGDLTFEGQVVASKNAEGQLTYDQPSSVASKISYHVLRTPRGGQYQIDLSDGTRVWLNAESSVRFPTSFTGEERVVEITGEVFFDVQKQNGKPFIVKTADQKITVLGTRFNVNAYVEESSVQTSLIEGKILLDVNSKRYNLNPGQRTTYDKGSKRVDTETFNPKEILAWQSGNFFFDAEGIESIMRKIARWYDVEIVYQGDMKDKIFSGTISRFGEVQDVLDMLALTGSVKFRIEGRRIYVMG